MSGAGRPRKDMDMKGSVGTPMTTETLRGRPWKAKKRKHCHMCHMTIWPGQWMKRDARTFLVHNKCPNKEESALLLEQYSQYERLKKEDKR